MRVGEVEKRAEREGKIEEEEFWSKEDGEKLGTKLLEMEAKRPAISATTIDMFTKFHHKYLTSILEDPCHQITELHKCNQPSLKANPLTKVVREHSSKIIQEWQSGVNSALFSCV